MVQETAYSDAKQREACSSRFEIGAQIGEGSFGRVFRAYDRSRGRTVAMKFLKYGTKDNYSAFQSEYRTLRALESPYVVRAYDWLEDTGERAFSMELIEGVSFVRWVREAGRCDERRLRHGLLQVTRALSTLCEHALIHRDLKPNNLLVTAQGHVTLIDFGLATRLDAEIPPQGRSDGTLAYMAPEQLVQQRLTCAADIYGLGVVCYEALTGRPPFEGDPRAQLLAKFGQRPHPPSRWVRGVTADLEAWVLDMLAVDPADRPTAQALQQRLGDAEHASSFAVRGC
ncbi:MAG TPA: serine/threonine-protein kinase [Polyangiales bacterium]|nr:serine/threonine-protein kinase [Polyangiales bacterium]